MPLCNINSIIGVIYVNDIITDQSIPGMPSWMEAMIQTLESPETHVNIRLFIIRVIDNCQQVFKPYAHHILRPVLNILADELAGTIINSFIADTVSFKTNQ